MTAAGNRAPDPLDWATLMNRPSAYIHATRLAACFDHRISARLCERLQGASRLQDRLSVMIVEFYRLAAPIGPDAVSPVDQKIATVPAASISNVVRRAGAVYWANAIARAVRAEEVRWLRDGLGEAIHTFALENRKLSGPPEKLEMADDADTRIVEDGVRCLAAWCRSQPVAIGQRVLLKSPPSPALDGAVQSPFNEIGPAIIRCAAA
jgi:YOP proteins translocation protein K (YscK)